MEKQKRPEIVSDDHLSYLDDLRESGETNMFGAVPYLQGMFGMSKSDARTILTYWMSTFGQSDR